MADLKVNSSPYLKPFLPSLTQMASLSPQPETWVLSFPATTVFPFYHGLFPGSTLPSDTAHLLTLSDVQTSHIHPIRMTILQSRCYYDHLYFADAEFEAQKGKVTHLRLYEWQKLGCKAVQSAFNLHAHQHGAVPCALLLLL